MVFGDALVRAYVAESQIARYPRILIPMAIVDSIPAHVRQRFVLQAEDGPFFLDVLSRVPDSLDSVNVLRPEREDFGVVDYFGKIRERLQHNFNEAVDTPKHFEKVQWFARYWNDAVADNSDMALRITWPGLDKIPATWG